MRCFRWHSETGDGLLYMLASIIVIVALTQSVLHGQEFSVHKARVLEQEPPKDALQMDFSIHQSEAPAIADELLIGFSVHNAKPFPKPDVGDSKPCTDQRLSNRVLVFVDGSTRTEQRQVQICEKGKPCRWILQSVQVRHDASQRALKELDKLTKEDAKWAASADIECVHFKIVDVTKSANVDMVKELKINLKDLPLLVKETEDERRKKADGMKANELAEWYLKQFVQPVPEGQAQAAQCVPAVGGFAFHTPQWYLKNGGNLRKHLMDPASEHHLPKAVVDQWSDAQVEAWHTWHHEMLEGRTVNAAPAKIKTTSKPANGTTQTKHRTTPTSLGYASGTFHSEVAQYALVVAQSSARSPPSQQSFSNDPKKAAKAHKKWKHDERERIRKEVSRAVWQQYSTFDPFTILTILSILIKVLRFVFQMYGLN